MLLLKALLHMLAAFLGTGMQTHEQGLRNCTIAPISIEQICT